MKESKFSLTIKHNQLTQKLIELEGEITLDLEQEMNALDMSIQEKTDAICFSANELEARIQFLKSQEELIYEARKQLEKNRDRFHESIIGFIQALGKEKLDGEIYSICLRKSPGKVFVDKADAIPTEYQIIKTVVDIDKKKIKEAIGIGIDVPGARVEYEPGLQLKIKK